MFKLAKVWTHETGWKVINDNNNTEVTIKSPGVFEKDGQIFVVKQNRTRTRLYAKKLVETSERLTQEGKKVNFDFVYDRGAIYNLSENDRMSVERAKEFMIRYGRCIACGRRLKVAKSIEQGLGPVCEKYFKSNN